MAKIVSHKPVAGTPLTFLVSSASSGGDYFTNTGRTLLYFKNSSADERIITVVSNGTLDGGLSVGNITVTIASGAEKILPTLPTRYFNDLNGYVNVTYDTATDIKIAVIEVNS